MGPRGFSMWRTECVSSDKWGAIAAMLVILGMLWFSGRVITGLLRTSDDDDSGRALDPKVSINVGPSHAAG